MKKIIFILCVFFLMINSCKDSDPSEPTDLPFNPFDTLSYPLPPIAQVSVDSNSFLGLHHYIFSQSCNQPACHDGTFEPDFRTVESAYNTLVYHPIKKNYTLNANGREPLPYRVTPFEAEQSMIYKRITEHLPEFERMPSSGIALSQDKIDLIKNWINDGAKDIFGNVPTLSSLQPGLYGLVAYLPNQNDLRVDTFRVDNFVYNSFIVPANEDIKMWLLFIDVDIEQNYVLGNGLTYNKIQFSADPYDFSNAIELDMQVELFSFNINSVLSTYSDDPFPYFQNLTINPTDLGFNSGETVYIRTYVRDADHSNPTENPSANSPIYLTRHFSFYIQ